MVGRRTTNISTHGTVPHSDKYYRKNAVQGFRDLGKKNEKQGFRLPGVRQEVPPEELAGAGARRFKEQRGSWSRARAGGEDRRLVRKPGAQEH